MKVLWLRPEGREIPSIDGIEAISLPVIELRCLPYSASELSYFEAVAFTSVNAVRCFRDRSLLQGKRIYAVGPATAKELGMDSVRVPSEYTTLAMVRTAVSDGVRSLIAFRSSTASDSLVRELAGKVNYVEVKNYTVVVLSEGVEAAKRVLASGEVDAVVLTSSTIASLVADSIPNGTAVISIGPETSKVLTSRGLTFLEAKEHDVQGLRRVLEEMRKWRTG
ncbi:hypothetical protein HS1genome_0899 [Sulfodiicoccus acidiphilus]|uniref:Tetrapyrrole biosynthesis uroporphyrinogen III synthase domain-containing protein n=1 Tax=Sulfodiicoccus acidiphilus TaxID=1670455 RepID=A0A348B2V8_9CREN|nr:uroporphyrinogen-III synthase [Sulfodiicoccus acidiphilus]BBD72510.1 hypothetical protein HS1genome_0899 [Sulfodiicoccus acidiphilus]GGT94023.1 hypothetical protein GCM10007116_09700 [Sulfodiicoccus acidiphilus]